MANYSTLKAAVADVVKTNGSQAITGANLQSVLLSIINSVGGGGYIFAGVATPSTNAGTPDQNVFYIGGAGTYANFGTSITVPVGSICVFKYKGSWVKEQIDLFAGIDDEPTAGSNNLVKSGGVYDVTNSLKSTDYDLSSLEFGFYVGYINASLNINSRDRYYKYCIVILDKTNDLIFDGAVTNNSSIKYLVFADRNFNLLSEGSRSNDGAGEVVIPYTSFPSNAVYAFITCRTQDTLFIENNGSLSLNRSKPNLFTDINKLNLFKDISYSIFASVNPGKNLIDKSNVLKGFFITSGGDLRENADYFVSNYIKQKEDTNIISNKGYFGGYVAYYDDKFNLLNEITPINTTNIPYEQEATYIRLSGQISNLDNWQVEYGDVSTEYKEFNPVEGYSFERIEDINSEIREEALLKIGYLSDSLSLKRNDRNFNWAFIKLDKNNDLIVKGAITNNVRITYLAFVDINLNILDDGKMVGTSSGQMQGNFSVLKEEYPSDAVYAIICKQSRGWAEGSVLIIENGIMPEYLDYDVIYNKLQIEKNRSEESNKVTSKFGKNLFQVDENTIGYYINSLGGLYQNDSYFCTTYIPLNGNNIKANKPFEGAFAWLYDVNFTPIQGTGTQQYSEPLEYQEGAVYARFSFNQRYINEIQIEYGDVSTVYEEPNPIAGYISEESAIEDLENIDFKIGDTEYFKELGQVLVLGQSLSVGGGNAASFNNYRNTLSMGYGVTMEFPNITNENINQSLVNAANTGTETPVRGMNEEMENVIETENNIDDFNLQGVQTIITSIGGGGAPISYIINNVSKILEVVQANYNKAKEVGKDYKFICVGYVQGEADKNIDEDGADVYYNNLWILYSELNKGIKNITGQKENIQWISYQTASYEKLNNNNKVMYPALMQLKFAKENVNAHLSAPTYHLFHQSSDLTHVGTDSTRLFGAMMGVAAKRVCWDKTYDFGFYPKSKSIYQENGKWIVAIQFQVPTPPLIFDNISPITGEPIVYKDHDGVITEIENQGFEFMNSDWVEGEPEYTYRPDGTTIQWICPTRANWNVQDIIESVEIVKQTIVKITCSSSPLGMELWYARRGNQGGGFLRDSQGNTIPQISVTSSKNAKVDNWCPIFMIKL